MERVGLIGVGNMGTGMAKNLVKKGFKLRAYDIRDEALREMAGLGADIAASPRQVGEESQVVFIMVLNGTQVEDVVTGKQGLLEGIMPGATVIVTATILRSIMIEVAALLEAKGIDVIDCPVSGGQPGAAAGTLTMMAAAKKEVFQRCHNVLNAVGKNIYHVGEEIGMGQTVKGALTALTGSCYGGIFESLVLGTKANIKPEILYKVISTSMVGNDLFRDTAKHIMNRHFQGAGACIQTMYKDLGITLSMARDSGVPMFTSSTAYQLFQAGISLRPQEDNWTIIKILEEIAGTEVKESAAEEK
ncbi:MAG: NAD(P)-dependent oxidoreductase [Desulfobacterales bacterium]|jgi:3-hydroxyisobutyrate dehydrogenase-like beta-hydroxyacid dehydrogenase